MPISTFLLPNSAEPEEYLLSRKNSEVTLVSRAVENFTYDDYLITGFQEDLGAFLISHENFTTVPTKSFYWVIYAKWRYSYESVPDSPYYYFRWEIADIVTITSPTPIVIYFEDRVEEGFKYGTIGDAIFPDGTIANSGKTPFGFELGAYQGATLTVDIYGRPKSKFATLDLRKPSYHDLVTGYTLDNRAIPDLPTITSSKTKAIKISYYQRNQLEPIHGLISICWRVYECTLAAEIPYQLPIKDCVLGTLYCSDSTILNLISALPDSPLKYRWSDLIPPSIPDLFAGWNALYDADNANPENIPIFPQSSKLHKLAANNDVWNNVDLSSNMDIEVDLNHPMFLVDEGRAYNWHIKPQFDDEDNPNGIGDLVMDSPRMIEIHKALGGSTFVRNRIKQNNERITNIGWYVENIARVLGLRFDDNGQIDSQSEETKYLRQILNSPLYDRQAYSKNSFGKVGRLTPHLSNSNGKDSWDKFADIPQMIEACFEHVNRSMGIQQGTEIKVQNSTTGKIDYYPNQLAMLLDIHAKITEMQLNSKQSFNLLYVISHELRELWSGIGIPMVYKALYNRYGEIRSIGHQSDKGSLLTHLTTLKINIGILVGNLIARPKDPQNPLERIFSKEKDGK